MIDNTQTQAPKYKEGQLVGHCSEGGSIGLITHVDVRVGQPSRYQVYWSVPPGPGGPGIETAARFLTVWWTERILVPRDGN